MTPSSAVIAGLAILGLSLGPGWTRTALAEGEPVTVLAAGDIAFCDRGLARQVYDWIWGLGSISGAPATAALLDRLPGTVLVMGDLAYWSGTAEEFDDCYDKSWGRHKARSRPVPGNHEYRSPGAGPYFDYWGERAGPPGRGYYSFDLGAWHLVALDSNLEGVEMARQLDWLVDDLAASTARCVLAYWHHPLFSSGKNRDQEQMAEVYRRLYEAGASVVLAGHDHNYERFAPMNPKGQLDPGRGIRSFVVGTGGGQLKAFAIGDPPRKNSEVVDGSTWGLLQLELYEDRYAWRFIPVEGATFTDSGEAPCVARDPPG
jgi:3',5'-cyclic AMP phosphodiesterase CpdA